MPTFIDITVSNESAVSRRDMRRLLKRSYANSASTWHERYRLKHFRTTAFGEYGYAPRSRAYERQKQRAVGHRRPLEYSGRSKRQSEQHRIRATYKGATLTMSVQGLNRKAKGQRANMPKELTTVSSREENTITIDAHKDVERGIRNHRRTRRIRVR